MIVLGERAEAGPYIIFSFSKGAVVKFTIDFRISWDERALQERKGGRNDIWIAGASERVLSRVTLMNL